MLSNQEDGRGYPDVPETVLFRGKERSDVGTFGSMYLLSDGNPSDTIRTEKNRASLTLVAAMAYAYLRITESKEGKGSPPETRGTFARRPKKENQRYFLRFFWKNQKQMNMIISKSCMTALVSDAAQVQLGYVELTLSEQL